MRAETANAALRKVHAMILTIDIGNTTIGIGGLEKTAQGDYTVCFTAKLASVRGRRGAAYLATLRSLLEDAGISPDRFVGAALSSVVPELTEPLCSCARVLTGTEPVLLTAKSHTGLILDVPEPDKLGHDRLADAAWAAARFPLPAVTVDMGTATTFNVVGDGRVFLGGVIAPGMMTGLNALSGRAAQLPEIELCAPRQVIGRTTDECMRAGAVVGAAAMIDGITARIEAELGNPATLVMTGGLARYVEPLCTHAHIYDPDMLLKGLALLYEWNAKPLAF